LSPEYRKTKLHPTVTLVTVRRISPVAAFTTDIPALSNWGEPLLPGPGSIHVAHTEGEYVEKGQLLEAVEPYCAVAKRLVA
jgi:acetylornithine deacetylase